MKQRKGFPKPNYTQTPNDFFDLIPEMEEAELRVTLVMIRNTLGFHRDSFKMGVEKLAAAAGLSRNGAKAGAEAAEARGTFRRANPDSIKEAEWELVFVDDPEMVDPEMVDPAMSEGSASEGATPQPVTGNPSASDGQVASKESNKEKVKKGDLVDAILNTASPKELEEKAATEAFERAFAFGTLPWFTGGSTWDKMRRFVTKIHKADPQAFQRYVIWRNGAGKFAAMNNKQIRLQPQAFMDTGWSEFEQSQQPSQPQSGGFLIGSLLKDQ